MKIIRPMAITDAVVVSSNVPETDHPAWSGATNYMKGAKVILASTHRRYESLIDNNLNKNPAAESAAWLDLGATNRWRLFDVSVGSQTTSAGSIDMTLQAVGRVDSIALLNISAVAVQVVMTDAVEGVVYDRTFDLVSDSGVSNWHSWYFEPIRRKRDFVVLGMPPYYGASIRVVLTDASGVVTCGVMVLGQAKDIGGTRWGASVGIVDYSKKEKNQFGEYIVVERTWAKRGRFSLQIPSGRLDDVMETLTQYRARPIVYVGAEQYGSSVIYGFFKDLEPVISYATFSDCSLEIEGMT